MKFTIISHACIYIEFEEIKLLIDPWLIGSCYWRSWWNYPKVQPDLIKDLKPTHIYITHLHWDHYHGPSLRKFEKFNPQIIFPKHFNKRMLGDCNRDFKFTKILEIDHGKEFRLSNNFKITSYQFNPVIIDSSLVVEANDITMLNCNDSKTFGNSLKQIIKNHSKFDFVFRSHSSASAIPHCIRGVNPNETDRSKIEYANDFIAFAKATKTKYIVPFASSHIYLHPMTRKYNKFYSNPEFVKSHFDAKINNSQRCVLMQSGSSWSKYDGFKVHHHDYSELKNDIDNYVAENQQKIDEQNKLEKKLKLNKLAFRNYFENFLKANSFPFRLIRFDFGFLIDELKTAKTFLCIVNSKLAKTLVVEINDDKDIFNYNLKFIIKTPIYVFNDCNLKKMHNTFAASKLLDIIITSKAGEKSLTKYLLLVDFYENDCLPLYKLVSKRNFGIIIRRWRELLDIFIYFFKIKFQRKKIYQLYSEI